MWLLQIQILALCILGISSGFLTFSPITRKVSGVSMNSIITRPAVLDPEEENDNIPRKKKFPVKRFRDIGEIYRDENLIQMKDKLSSIFNESNYCNVTNIIL